MTDGRTHSRSDNAKSISLRLRQGIIIIEFWHNTKCSKICEVYYNAHLIRNIKLFEVIGVTSTYIERDFKEEWRGRHGRLDDPVQLGWGELFATCP